MTGSRLTGPLLALVGCAALVGGTGLYVGIERERSEARRARASELTGGHPELAEAHILRYGCAACHVIPGIRTPNGLVGPPLEDIGRRIYIAGVLTNTPENMVRWIVDPPAVDEKTAMPVTGISEAEARDVAAYLYSLR